MRKKRSKLGDGRIVEVNLFEINDRHSLQSNWWHHIKIKDFGFLERLQNIASYEVELGDILFLKQKAPEGFFEKYWFIVTDKGVERTDLSEIKEVLSESLVDFVNRNGKLPYSCVVAKLFKNKKVQVNYEPTYYDIIVMKFSPGDFDIEDVQGFFEDLDAVEMNPIDSGLVTKARTVTPSTSKSKKVKLFPPNKRITIQKGTIQNIEEMTQKYEGEIYSVYLLHLVEGIYEVEGEGETSFDEVYAQISENLFNKMNPKVGDSVYCKGRTKNHFKLGDIVHNIRTIKLS
ncbi:MAG: hypothetical protein JW776_01370 [Candidatus Lokiarchaeota archaeon]|nr:hypothetical protein [Candidatus Lokiarchaeota archaeon]